VSGRSLLQRRGTCDQLRTRTSAPPSSPPDASSIRAHPDPRLHAGGHPAL